MAERTVDSGNEKSPEDPKTYKSHVKTSPWGIQAYPDGTPAQPEAEIPSPDLPQRPAATGEEVAAQVMAVSQVAGQSQPEMVANYP